MDDISKKETSSPQVSKTEGAPFLRTDGGKTASNAIEIPSISLPKGGGAIKGIDEKFSVNAVNGTASFSIPLPIAPARGAIPSLSLSYNSGSGNSPFGLGWSLNLPSIKRKTNQELPQYLDAAESDTFLFSEAEDLVPAYKKVADSGFEQDTEGNYVIDEKSTPDNAYTIRYYRPRVEGAFARIERWTKKASGETRWKVTTRDNVTTLFGWSAKSRIADPDDVTRIFEWLPEFVFDDKGNCAHYIYKKEDNAGLDPKNLSNRNRLQDGRITYTNQYLEKVLYGNKTPYKGLPDPYPPEDVYMFQTVLDYGEYSTEPPYNRQKDWDVRKDSFSDYKSGFEVRTTRLCKRVLLFHYFEELPGGFALVKSLDFNYDTAAEEGFTFLKAITTRGYLKQADGTYTHKALPPVEFEYQKHNWNTTLKTIDREDLVHAPSGLDEPLYQFTDLYNEGLAGILTEQGDGWYYKHNLGEGKFAQAQLVAPKPSFAGLGGPLQLMDLDADGGKQLVNLNAEPKGFFELNDAEEWESFQSFASLPNVDLTDPNTRMLDLDGDGKPEVLITEENAFTWFASRGRKGFQEYRKTVQPLDEEKGPRIVFAEALQTIFLADMSGDGLSDIVRIRNGEVCYWPNLGYGQFGAKVSMDHAPVFDEPDAFQPAYLRLADIDGSGTTDIIYLGNNRFTCWMNLSGNSFSTTPFEIVPFPEVHEQAQITVTDLLGSGVPCIVWSSSLAKDAHAPLQYMDLMGSKKPHIMVRSKNNMGKEVSLEYTPSTKFYIEDKLAGRPWVTKLHFPVHCVSKTETRDKISGYRFVSTYKYHHGYYDHAEREFRGFGMVEQIDAEHFAHWVKGKASNIVDQALHQEPVVSKSWFHTGAWVGEDTILNQFAHEYWHEEMRRQGDEVGSYEYALPDAHLIVALGLDPDLLNQLSAQEWREALRACKGMPLRSEVFAQDAPLEDATTEQIKQELTPYAVTDNNCVITLVQPKGNNKHAVFTVNQSESITYSYERDTADPRIAHTLNIKFDPYGHVLESAAVVYPRMQVDTSLPDATQQEQSRTLITYTKNQFTNDVISDKAYRLRLPSEVEAFELKGVAKTGDFYTVSDFEKVLDQAEVVAYHQMYIAPTPGTAQKRLMEHVRTTYYKDDLTGTLPLHKLESMALPFEGYQLAYTPALLRDIFGDKVDGDLMQEGKFTHSEGDDSWWVRSGTTQFITESETAADAQSRFYLPVSYTDPYGAVTKVKYYENYFLFIEETEDALGNRARVDLFDFRTLAPKRMQDPNNNLSEVLVDELGMVKAMAVLGKGEEADDLDGLNEATEGDEDTLIRNFLNVPDSITLTTHGKALLQHATARFAYDLDAYRRIGKPLVAASIVREEHFQKNNDAPIQLSFEYSNGMGQVVMQKVQAEPGLAKQADINDDGTYTITEVDTAALASPQLRWIGNGRTVLNNKGNPVKQYEPYFSTTHQYEDLKELVETGVTPLLYYDALGRMVKTDLPDGTFVKTVFDSWQQRTYDQHDTVLDSDWYHKRSNNLIEEELIEAGKDPVKEKKAADQAAQHEDTPNVQHLDTLGRPILSVEHNRAIESGEDVFYRTQAAIDTEGNLRSVTDARGNEVMQYKYDMLGNKVYQKSMDAGQRWMLLNIVGNPLRTWDERNHEFQYFYDILQRPVYSKVLGGDGDTMLDHVFERIFYGEDEPNPEEENLRLQVVRRYDTAGLVATPAYDFKGQPISTTRRLFRKYKEVVNWIDTQLEVDLEAAPYIFSTETDALGRITKQVAPDGSVITPSYNRTGLLNGETVTHTHETPAITTTYLQNIDYNEKGQRTRIVYGNGVTTTYKYDAKTFRLISLTTKKANDQLLQNLHYTFDGVGNITHIHDKAVPTIFFDNAKLEPAQTYTYDALYRLVAATGRENNEGALAFGDKDNWNDAPFRSELNAGDPMAMRDYTQTYQYDGVGNILQMHHQAGTYSWTRNYRYESANNRLMTTQVGDHTYTYPHHTQHGYMTAMPHLEAIDWNFKEEVVKTIRQKRTDGGTPETTYYQYDGEGQRIRKITENQASVGSASTLKDERIYLAGYELYKKHSGTHAGLERTSLSLMDGDHRFVMIETRNDVDDGTEKHLVRYQLHNHLGSATLELEGSSDARVISYEEYHPYGTTAYQATNAAIKAAAKRYRYTGMERDEETGLEYHSARYYLPWLGRWLSADPMGIEDGVNPYQYVKGNPLAKLDPSGSIGEFFEKIPPQLTGFFMLVGGGAEIIAGGAFILAPEPVTTAVGIIALVHGVDTMQTGFNQMLSGEYTNTLTSQGLQKLGLEESTANWVDTGLGFCLAWRVPLPKSSLTRTTTNSNTIGLADDLSSVSLRYKSNTGTMPVSGKEISGGSNMIGHNVVGVNTGTGTKWSELYMKELDLPYYLKQTGLFKGKKGAHVRMVDPKEIAKRGGYDVISIPVSVENAELAYQSMNINQGFIGLYKLGLLDCATYAQKVLKSANVMQKLPITSPGLNYYRVSFQAWRMRVTAGPVGAVSRVFSQIFSRDQVEAESTTKEVSNSKKATSLFPQYYPSVFDEGAGLNQRTMQWLLYGK